jgi:hypothetical protein
MSSIYLNSHVVRMNDNEPQKIITSNPGGLRARGRPELRLIDGAEEEARRLGCRNRKTAAQDRDGWRKIVEEAKVHHGL